MQNDGPDEPFAAKGSQQLPVNQTSFHWPWGVVALAVLALGWVGLYLLWNGVVLLFQL
jgi:hypothetical protein